MKENPIIEHYQAEFERLQPALPGSDKQRKAAFQSFARKGFPTTREEAWKYTDLRALSRQTPAVLSSNDTEPGPDQTDSTVQDAIAAVSPHDWNAIQVSIVNGAVTIPEDLPAGVQISALSEALANQSIELADSEQPLRALNTALVSAGVVISIEDGMALEKPIHLLCLQTQEAAAMLNLRHEIRLGAGASCELLEHYEGSETAKHFLNAVTKVSLASNAKLEQVLLQNDAAAAWHLHASEVTQASNSVASITNIDLGGRLSRADSEISLDEPGAEIHLNGFYFPSGRQHIDSHTTIDHRSAGCTSRETYHGLIKDHGRGVFNGRIIVHKDAQKTDSEQNSKAILLSKNAEVDAKPELEIYADDVKCAHGATVGQLDEDALFYLQSRGVDKDTAHALLVYSFADEVIGQIQDQAVRRHVESLVMNRLPGGLSADEVLGNE